MFQTRIPRPYLTLDQQLQNIEVPKRHEQNIKFAKWYEARYLEDNSPSVPDKRPTILVRDGSFKRSYSSHQRSEMVRDLRKFGRGVYLIHTIGEKIDFDLADMLALKRAPKYFPSIRDSHHHLYRGPHLDVGKQNRT